MVKKKKYTFEYPISDMICFKNYCNDKGLKQGEELSKMLNNFLVDKGPEIKRFMREREKKITFREKREED